MKTIAVFFTRPETNDYPLNEDYYRIAYRELASLIEAKGARLVIVRSVQTHLGKGTFSKYWVIDEDMFRMVEESITPDLIYNKGKFKGDAPSILNSPGLDEVTLDKRKTYAHFADLCPKSIEVTSADMARSAADSFEGEMIVVKPVDGEEGKGVIIGKKEEVLSQIPSYPYIVQEFIDTSKGIPGITEGLHDLRMTLINGELCNCFVRIPAKGKFVSNLAQGGSKLEVPFDKLPKAAWELAQKVDVDFERFGKRIYSVDCGRDASGRWVIIELNSQPGVTCSSEGPISINFQNKLATALVEA